MSAATCTLIRVPSGTVMVGGMPEFRLVSALAISTSTCPAADEVPVAPMATPNCPTYGRSNCPRQDDQIMTSQD